MMKRLFIVTCVAMVVSVMGTSTATAMSKFKKSFEVKYVKESDNDDLKAAFKSARCFICHIKGVKDKGMRNDYGDALAELIPGDAKERLDAAKAAGKDKEEAKKLRKAEETKILEELQAAFEKSEELESPTGETYGERIKQGKMPQDIVEKKEEEDKEEEKE